MFRGPQQSRRRPGPEVGDSEKKGVSYFGVLNIRILLFGVL